MSTAGALDDYLEALLGDAAAAAPAVAPAAPARAAAPASSVPGDTPELEAAFEEALAAVEAAAPVAANAPARSVPGGDTPELEAAFEEALAAMQAPAPVAVSEPARSVPGDTPELEAAFEEAFAAAQQAAAATTEREPTWDDLPDEVLHETAPPAAAAAPAREPTWDDLPDEVIFETGPGDSTALTHADSPGLQAAFDVAAGVAAPAPAAPAPAPPPAAPRPAPAARAQPARPAPAAAPQDAPGRPGSWQELQAQNTRPANSPHPQGRRAAERTSRWLRLRCGSQAYALELLKVQEVVLPVPLLPLRGTAPAMLGIMNLRGQVVPVIDLGLHLGTSPAADDAQTRIVVLEEDGETLGLRVSAVEDVANLTDSQIEPPDTARICQISNDIFRGVARVTQRPMILLDATRLLN